MTNSSITKKYVLDWLSRNIGKQSQPGGQTSFVAPYPSYEFQMDSVFINDLGPQKYKNGTVCIDIFSKYAVVIPMQGKTGPQCAAGIMESLEKMRLAGLKKPHILYTDEQGFSSDDLKEWYPQQSIKHYITRNHAQFSDRCIGT